MTARTIIEAGASLDSKGYIDRPRRNGTPMAQNTGIAAVGPGPGVSARAMHHEGDRLPDMASVDDLLRSRRA